MDALLNNAPCGFLAFTEDGTILQVNETLAAWLDYKPEQLTDQPLDSILTLGSRLFCQTHFFPLLKLQGYVEELYFSLRSKNEESVPMLVNTQRRTREGQVVYDCIFMRMNRRDQYENKILLAKQLAEESSQAKVDILTMLSHEFRTPLNAIMGFTEILSLELENVLTKTQKEYIASINTGSEELLHLTSSILQYFEIDMGQAEFDIQPINIEGTLIQAEIAMVKRLREAKLNYNREDCDQNLMVYADLNFMQQILVNLLENAIKFSEEGDSVYITCTETKNKVFIHVSDTGQGIPDDQLQRIFEPFIQLNRAQIKTNQKGVGLGLAISRNLARSMNCDITARSTLGQGSIFTVALPKYEN